MADKDSKESVGIAQSLLKILGAEIVGPRKSGQTAGAEFERICADFLGEVFPHLSHLRQGTWEVRQGQGALKLAIAEYDQYQHLRALDDAAKSDRELAVVLGNDYLIKPDIVILRHPELEPRLNERELLVDESVARLSSLRALNTLSPHLHASISCKWTIRSDRAQNARSEASNLIRNRKGRLPHIVVLTGEPTPNRIASIAMGTGDIDCVYHFALNELMEAVAECGAAKSADLLSVMLEGKRLRDISDLPLDLVI